MMNCIDWVVQLCALADKAAAVSIDIMIPFMEFCDNFTAMQPRYLPVDLMNVN